LLLGVWVLLSGELDRLHLSLGVATAIAVARADLRLSPAGWFPAHRFLAFLPWLLLQVLLSNLRVARLALAPAARIRPSLVETDPAIADERALAVLACAITLTPGTLAVESEPGRLLVHALDPASAADVRSGSPADRVAAIFAWVGP
jgi:multisubunit Na+/H+ antiporter MnhE subunit